MISLIITVKNEVSHLPDWFKSIKEQTLQPDEIIIVDGGSEDGTYEFLEKVKQENSLIEVFKEPGNIAHGRNYAIRKSKGNIIVVTDAGCIYDKNWLKSISEPLSNKSCVWSATAFAPWFIENDGVLIYSIASSTIPAESEFRQAWRPSSRSVAFYKDRWQTVGGYPEWIPFCEDVLFDLKLIRKEGQPFFVKSPMVFWRPRTTLARYFRQLFNYTRSEGHGKINTMRQVIRYLVYTFALVCLGYIYYVSEIFALPLLAGLFVYMSKFIKRWFEFSKNKNTAFRFSGIFLVPLVVAIGDLAKMIGYAVGFMERITRTGGIEYY